MYNTRDRISQKFNISPKARCGLVNFATIVYRFLPHQPSLFLDPEDRNPHDVVSGTSWRIAIPARQEYMALCLLFHPDRNLEGEEWMQRLSSEWRKWEQLGDGDKSVATMEELGRALVRERLKFEALQGCVPASISARILKWQS